MIIFDLFDELDRITLRHLGEDVCQTERGKEIIEQLISQENRVQLRAWYKCHPRINPAAKEFKEMLEREIGEEF